jgi:hypothetical protein
MSSVAEAAAHACGTGPAISAPPESRVKPRILNQLSMPIPNRRLDQVDREFAGNLAATILAINTA